MILGALVPSAVQALPDPAPQDVTAVATLTKTASVTTVAPGDTFTYTLTIGCSSITDHGCRGAVLTDVVPAPFEVIGAVVGTGSNTAADPAISGSTVTVTWTTDLGDGTVGILDNTTGTVQITVRLPADASYDANGVEAINSAVIEGTNFIDVSDQAGVTPSIPMVLGTTATKTLDPSVLLATPGTPVTASLAGTNTSNATVDQLVIQDPVDPTATPNPFEYLGFVGFGAVTPPAGTTSTTYEVYVPTSWVAAPGGVLPSGVDPTTVRGARVTFTGAIPAGESGSVVLDLALTDAAAGEPDGTVVLNSVQSEVTRDGQTAQADDDASLVLQQNEVRVGVTKSFDPQVVVAGESSTVTLGAVNTSSVPIESLTIHEPASGGFPPEYTFGGFTAGIGYPSGATSGTVVLYLASPPGGTVEIPFSDGQTPQIPSTVDLASVVSFDVVFEGSINPGGETTVVFDVVTDPSLDPASLPVTVNNEVEVVGENLGATGSATADDNLYIYGEVIETYVGKTIRPSMILGVPGENVTVSLTGGLTERPNPPGTPEGSTGSASQVVLQDPPDPVTPDAWWNAFDLTAITQTPVPACSTLTIYYDDTSSDLWEPLPVGPIAGPTIYSGAIDASVQAVAGGIRFVYDYTAGGVCDAAGFAPGTDFAPNFSAELRSDGRYTPGTPLLGDPEVETTLSNCAVTSGTSPTPGVAGAISAPGCDDVVLVPVEPGVGNGMIDKAFGVSSSGGIKTVIARSGDTIPSVLGWSTGGYSNLTSVQITDIADPAGTAIVDSVFDAFNLTTIQAITPATDPLIAFDQVQDVQLWNGTAWVSAQNSQCPAGCIGQMPQILLSPAEQASTTGVRIIVVESPDRAAASVGNLDAPLVGSGVARSFTARPITLVWQVRDVRRSDGTPVLGDVVYNLTDPGDVLNTVDVTGYPEAGGTVSEQASDDVVIIDVPITTTTSKTWSGGPVAIPASPGGGAVYPTSRITVTTRNTTPARVDQLIISDPAPGATGADLGAFDAFTLYGIAAITVPAGTTSTVVTLFCPDGTSQSYTRAQALALNSTTMPCDVTGVQVAFDGRIMADAVGVIVFDVQLRAYWRGTTDLVTVADSPVFNRAEGVVADVDPPGPCPPGTGDRYACADASANITLAEPTFGVAASKSIVPASQKEGDFSPVTVTIGGQPTGTVRTQTMTLEDSDPTFWNAFDFVGMDPSWAFVPPTGRVQACYLSGASFTVTNIENNTVGGTWTCQIPASSMPIADAVAFLAAAAGSVEGVRFTFTSTVSGGWQNPASPHVTVPFLVERRQTYRSGGAVQSTRSDQQIPPGETELGTYVDTSTAHAVSVDGPIEGIPFATADDDASASYVYQHLSVAVSVEKSPDGDVPPGKVIPFTLSFTNTGELPLVDPVFSDRLPTDANGPQLIFDPDADPTVPQWSFALAGAAPTPPHGTPLPTDPAQVTVTQVGTEIFFGMPAGSVLEPGQTYTITILLMLRPGVTPADAVQNWAVIDIGDIPFDVDGDGNVIGCVPTYGVSVDGHSLCMDDAVVSPLAVPAISTVKRVKADAPHGQPGIPEVFSATAGFDCTGQADANGFYRSPCIPVTLPGATETWEFTVTNAGTLPLSTLTSIDSLPIPGDTGVVVTTARGSQWEPTFVGAPQLLGAPAGATLETFTSTSFTTCAVGSDLNTCAPVSWTPLATTPDLSAVRSLKLVVTFQPGALFDPAEDLTIQLQTRTTPSQIIDSSFPIAWNTVATSGFSDDAQLVPATEGRRVGISYPTGPIQLQKLVSGEAAAHAPGSFRVQLVCTYDDDQNPSTPNVPLQNLPEVTLVPGADPTQIDGLPWGAECTATEEPQGQTSQFIDTAVVGGPEDTIGLVTVSNIFGIADLVILKRVISSAVDAEGDPVGYGPFTFTVECLYDEPGDVPDLGPQPIWADGYDVDNPMVADLWPGNVWALSGLPTGTQCTVTETDSLGAQSVQMVVNEGGRLQPPVDGDTVTVDIEQTYAISVMGVNRFGVGSLELQKIVDGPAAVFGVGPFVLHVQCVLDTGEGEVPVWDGDVTLGGGNPLSTTIDDIAAGAVCTVAETDDGAATSTVIDPDTGVQIASGETVTVTATNTFEAGSLTVRKVMDGQGAQMWGAGPFEVTLECRTEQGAAVAIPGGATRRLSTLNAFTASYDPLLHGLRCTLTETGTGGATSTTITDSDGNPVGEITIVQDEQLELVVTNTFDLGAITVTKTVSGPEASGHAGQTFVVLLACQWRGGPVTIPGGADRALTTTTGVRYENLPVGARCAVTETDSGGASTVTFTPADPTDPTRAVVTVQPGAAASVTVDNLFDFRSQVLASTGGDCAPLTLLALLLIAAGALARSTVRKSQTSTG
ncbi:MAG: DUF11 domain-containing protein [Micrococcales bacterium]|nr:DUF11 domain-containing protein [Micrococcales bacterium]